MKISLREVEEIADVLNVDTTIIAPEMLREGMLVELEHGKIDPRTNVTDDDLVVTAKIALAHLVEDPHYYSRLEPLEDEGKEYWRTRVKPNVFSGQKNRGGGELKLVLAFGEVKFGELMPSESVPTLRVFPSKHITASRTVTEQRVRESRPKETMGLPRQAMVLHWKDCFAEIDGRKAAVLFQVICQTTVDDGHGKKGYGYKRREPLGSALVPLTELLEKGYRKQNVSIAITDRSRDDPIVRMTLDVKVLELTIVPPTTVRLGDFDWDALRKHGETCETVVSRFFDFYRRDDVNPVIERAYSMHIPRYRLIAGCIPGAMYRFTTLDKPMTEAFARHILVTTIELNGWTPEEATKLLEKQMEPDNAAYYAETNAVMRMIGEAITTTANCMDYMSDHSGEEDVEWFKFSRAGLYAGDCEDVGEESALVATSLKNLRRAKVAISGAEKKDDLVQAVANILSRYIVMLVTAMATAPSAGSRQKSSQYICHIYACAVPRLHVLRMIEEGVKFLGEGTATSLAGLREAMNGDVKFTKWERGLILLILEGTNWCNPLQLPLPLYAPKEHREKLVKEIVRIEQFRSDLENEAPTFRGLSVQIQQRNFTAVDVMAIPQESYSGFYRWLIDAWIDLRAYGVRDAVDFSMGHVDPEGNHVYGIDFRDWVMMNGTNSAGHATALVPTYLLSSEDWDSIEYLRDYEYPVPEWTKVPEPMKIPELEAMRTRSEYPRRRSPYAPPYAVYRINRREKITPQLLGELKATLTQNSGAKMDYLVHSFAEDGELYFIELRMYPKK